jgi:O-antigen ligase
MSLTKNKQIMKYLSTLNKQAFLNQLAFYSLLGSGIFIVLLWSPHVLGPYLDLDAKNFIYLFPWLMVCLTYSYEVFTDRAHRPEIILIISIIILGIVNVSLSDSLSNSLNPMRTFLLTGIFALWVSMFLLTSPHRRAGFDWLCCGFLAIIVTTNIILWLVRGKYGSGVFQTFTNHPIPLGTLLILLSTGPIHLLTSRNLRLKLTGGLLLLASAFLIFLTHKRGTWIAVAAMLALGLIYLVRRRRYLVVSLVLAMALILPLQAKHLIDRLNPKVAHDESILNRLELYPFAWHIWRIHPVMGIGLRSFTHQNYLAGYRQHNQALHNFPRTVAELQTFDNMLLTGFVEMGTVMTLLYLGLIIFIVWRYMNKLWSEPKSSGLEWYRLLVLVGFAIHSLSYDSLLFPPVNWLFHVQLGLMAGYQAGRSGAAEFVASWRKLPTN